MQTLMVAGQRNLLKMRMKGFPKWQMIIEFPSAIQYHGLLLYPRNPMSNK